MKHRLHYGRAMMCALLMVMLVSIPVGLKADSHANALKALNEQLVMGTLWYQKAAEVRALCYQAFNSAKLVFDMDLEKGPAGKKRAVVVDIDETVLDNSPYEVGLVGQNSGYPAGWKEWLNAAQAAAVPGAVDFLKYVVENGGDVFYVSNRKIASKSVTMANLKAKGFPQVLDDHVLLREKTSDKEPRRQRVRENHRIVLIMGDNLNDFDNMFRKKGIVDRFDAVDAAKDRFGAQFIVLPNPMYGDWEGAVYQYNWKLSPEQKSEARKSNLDMWRP